MFKHQANCYRNINGVRYENFSDLCESEMEKQIISEAKAQFKNVRVMLRDKDGLKAVFVANKK